jgi:hypothetical protein
MKSIGLRHARTVRVVSITLGYMLLLAVVSQAQCSNRTLTGSYSFTVEGQILGVGLVNGVAETHFDGAGNLTQVDLVVHAGVVPPGWRPGTGSYTVNGDCTGNALITPAIGPTLNLQFVVLKNGNEIRTVVANPGYQVNSIGVRSSDDEED